MKRLWLITNFASGSAGAETCDAIEAIFGERGLVLAGRTQFPNEAIPEPGELDAASVDTLVLFAGDGTINAAACKLDRWGGTALVLPGGTMNMLAKQLHGDAEPAAIIHAAHAAARTIRLPFVEAGPHRAFVALILGPAGTWARAREAAREGRLMRLWRAARYAWRRSWRAEISVHDGGRRRGRYNAVIAVPDDGRLKISSIAAERWADAAQLGWQWLTGDWRSAAAVDDVQRREVVISGRSTILALFDGEEAKLESPVAIKAGCSELSFITTVEAP